MNANAKQVAGTHYKTKYEHWDLVADLGLGYFEGQITKYVSRASKKHGVQDLQKATHFLEKLLELTHVHGLSCRGSAVSGYSGRTRIGENVASVTLLKRFGDANALTPDEREVVRLVATWGPHTQNLHEAYASLLHMLEEYPSKDVPDTEGSAPGPNYTNQDR